MFSGRVCRTLLGMLLLYASVLAGTNSGRVSGSPISHERYQVTTFGAERRARWSLEGKTAIVTGGTKVRHSRSYVTFAFTVETAVSCDLVHHARLDWGPQG